MSLKMSSVSTSSSGGACPAGALQEVGPGQPRREAGGCRKSTGGQKVLLGWHRECAEAMESEAEKGHGTSGGTLTVVARVTISKWSVGFYHYYQCFVHPEFKESNNSVEFCRLKNTKPAAPLTHPSHFDFPLPEQ